LVNGYLANNLGTELIEFWYYNDIKKSIDGCEPIYNSKISAQIHIETDEWEQEGLKYGKVPVIGRLGLFHLYSKPMGILY